ncbi:MAG: hypothetical protein AMXMBFR53_43040 [Gemmatimonadota bacterium]
MGGKTMGLMAVAAFAAVGASGLAAQDADFRWQQEMRAGQVLAVQGIVGSIRAEYASGSRAEVIATKDGRARDFEEVEIRVVEERDGWTVCAVYHASSADREGCDNNHSDRGDWGRRRSLDVDVDYVVRVPAGVEFHGGIVSGDVIARGLRSEVRASSVDGDIFVSTTDKAWANTVSGDMEIEMGATDWDELDFRTVSGDITLWLPAGLETDVDFESLSGDIVSDFDITATRKRTRRWVGEELEGYIGSRGQRSLTFNTVSGDVELRRKR